MWYAEAAIYVKKLIFSNFIVFSSSLVNNTGKTGKLTKRDKAEYGKKCYYASDILFEWPQT